jgi:hypothetical protein
VTFFRSASFGDAVASLAGVRAVVVSPILRDGDREVIGAIYGTRDADWDDRSLSISAAEALLVKMLAAVVGAGVARLGAEVAGAGYLNVLRMARAPINQAIVDPKIDVL